MNRGDPETDARRRFGTLCESLRPDLLRFAFWLGRDRQLAEDVVQEAMLRAWKSFGSLEDEAKARSWLLTIVRREFARSFEKKRLEVADLDPQLLRLDGGAHHGPVTGVDEGVGDEFAGEQFGHLAGARSAPGGQQLP